MNAMIMKHIGLSIVVTLATVYITACNRSIGNNDKDNCKLTKISSINNRTTELTYDDSGKISKINRDTEYELYKYTTDKITILYQNTSDVLMLKDEKITTSNEVKYTYNPSGYLVKLEHHPNLGISISIDLSYSNGNLTKLVETNKLLGSKATTTYKYTADLAPSNLPVVNPIFNIVVHPFLLTNKYFGKLSKNLISKSTYVKELHADSTNLNSKYYQAEVRVSTFQYDKDNSGNYRSSTITLDYSDSDRDGKHRTSSYTQTIKKIYAYSCCTVWTDKESLLEAIPPVHHLPHPKKASSGELKKDQTNFR